MKNLIYLLSLVFLSVSFAPEVINFKSESSSLKQNSTVHICNGQHSKRYHSKPSCASGNVDHRFLKLVFEKPEVLEDPSVGGVLDEYFLVEIEGQTGINFF